MPGLDLVDHRRPVPIVRRSGAKAVGTFFEVILEDDDDLRTFSPAGAVTVLSPRDSAGAHPNLDILINGDGRKRYPLSGGGNPLEIPGPIYSVRIKVLDNDVAGADDDDIAVIFTAGDKKR